MLMDNGADRKYPSTIHLHINVPDDSKVFLKEVLIQCAKLYKEHANIRIQFIRLPTIHNYIDIGLLSEELAAQFGGHAHIAKPVDYYRKNRFYNVINLSPFALQREPFYLQQVVLHEMGHAFFAAMHPFETHINNTLSSETLSQFLDNPEITRMTYARIGNTVAIYQLPNIEKLIDYFKGLFIHQNIPYCDTVIAVEKYGQNLQYQNQSVHHFLTENTGHAYTLSNRGGIGVFDGQHLKASAHFVLRAGFEPTVISGTFYYLGHKSDITQVFTSPFADTIRLGNIHHEIHIMGGLQKGIIIQPDCQLSDIYGFRANIDYIRAQGFDNSVNPFRIVSNATCTHLYFGNQTVLKLHGFSAEDLNNIIMYFEENKEDGIDYMLLHAHDYVTRYAFLLVLYVLFFLGLGKTIGEIKNALCKKKTTPKNANIASPITFQYQRHISENKTNQTNHEEQEFTEKFKALSI